MGGGLFPLQVNRPPLPFSLGWMLNKSKWETTKVLFILGTKENAGFRPGVFVSSIGWMSYRNLCNNPLQWSFFRADVNAGHHLTSSSSDPSFFPGCSPALTCLDYVIIMRPAPRGIFEGTLTAFSLLQHISKKGHKQFRKAFFPTEWCLVPRSTHLALTEALSQYNERFQGTSSPLAAEASLPKENAYQLSESFIFNWRRQLSIRMTVKSMWVPWTAKIWDITLKGVQFEVSVWGRLYAK